MWALFSRHYRSLNKIYAFLGPSACLLTILAGVAFVNLMLYGDISINVLVLHIRWYSDRSLNMRGYRPGLRAPQCVTMSYRAPARMDLAGKERRQLEPDLDTESGDERKHFDGCPAGMRCPRVPIMQARDLAFMV
ncbi:hypothetical protein B0A54_03505 [Friedmanniomyces endolithicus]|uniref:Uncharacterized protein n=1 Tax=Friedmanniomyces endolithicus TaxID=329885 RepID=A0A4U0VA85_9PEZI|nr:hypothetical protein LTS09_004051 [Friedmanniomyces endolithicus]TKA45820.1 hypothetical protein B0A54_03505 [Friedmanniomyces endolithicus]